MFSEIMKKLLLISIFLLSPALQAANFNLPASIGSGPFSDCSGSGPSYSCDDNIDIGNNDSITLTANVTLVIDGNLDIGNGFDIISNGFSLVFNVDGNVDIGNTTNFTADIIADGNVDIGNSATFTGNITADGNIDIGNTGSFTGNITSDNSLDIGNGTTVNGVCTPNHPACNGGGGGNLVCVTFRDEFSSNSYSRQDGSANWASNWIETGDNNNPGNGEIEINAGRLQLEGNGTGGGHAAFGGAPSIEREADLSSYSSATLSFDYSETGNWEGNDDIEIWLSTDGGNSWGGGPIHTFTNDQGDTPQLFSQDISAFISANTRVALVEKANSSAEVFYIDNLQIEACSAGPPAGPIAEYHLDESNWNGTPNEVIDSSGNGYDGTASSLSGATPTTTDASPAIAGDPGTCRYGVFTRARKDYIALPSSFPNLGSNGQAFTITAWIRTTDRTRTGQRIFIDDENNSQGYGFSLGDGGTGQLRFFSRGTPSRLILDTGNVIANNTWYFVAAVADVPNKVKRIYVFNSAGSLLTSVSSPPWTEASFGFDSGIASIGGETNAAGENNSDFGFSGNIDEVKIYTQALTTDQVAAIMQDTRPCLGTPTPDHFHISHSGTGIICEPSTIEITAHNADHSVFTATSDLTLTVSSDSLDGVILPTNPTIPAGSSSTTVQLSQPTLTAAPHININVASGLITETSGNADTNPASPTYDDPRIQFVDTLFVFTVFNSFGFFPPPTTIVPTQIAGKPSTSAPNNKLMTVRAIRAGADPVLTASCTAALSPGSHNIRFGYQCIDSDSCSTDDMKFSNQLNFNAASAVSIARNNGLSFANSTVVPVVFNNAGVASVSFRYDNAGRIALFADTHVVAPGNIINRGVTNSFIVRPFALPLDFGDSGDGDGDLFDMRQDDFNSGGLDGSNNDLSYSDSDPAANPQNSSVFKIAGEDFTAEVSAVLWQSADDTNGDGLPDSNANLYDNSLATLFGQELIPPVLAFNHTLKSPSGPNSGNLQATFSAAYNGGKTLGTLNWSEVGIIDISVSLPDYLGDGLYNAATTTRDVGRFRPAGFRLGTIDNGVFEHACGSFTYTGQGFGFLNNPSFVVESINALPSPTVTQNYTGLWAKLDAATSFNLTAPATAIIGTDGNPLSIEPTAAPSVSMTDNGNGSFAVSFNNTTFCYGEGSPCAKQENTVLAPFDSDISITLQSITDGELSTGFGQTFTPLATSIRYGRLAMDNIFGSELTSLTMPMYTEYFDGSNFLLNSDDFCTLILDADLAQDNPEGLVSTVSVINSPPALSTGGGILNVQLTAPGAGNTGPITLTPDLSDLTLPNHIIPPDPIAPSWLQHDWDADAAGLENPSATATFGIFKGNSRQIYYRQIFR